MWGKILVSVKRVISEIVRVKFGVGRLKILIRVNFGQGKLKNCRG